MVDAIIDWLAALPAIPTYLVLMVLSSLENVFPPVPADTAVVLGAFLARRGELSVVLLGALCWLANTGTAAGVYYFARTHGPEFFERGLGRRLLPPSVYRGLSDFYERHGVMGVFLSRFLPGLRAGVLPFAGVTRMSPRRALLPAAAASAVWYAVLAAAGSWVAGSWDVVKGFVEDANRLLAFVSVLAMVAVAIWVWRRIRAHKAAASRQGGDRGTGLAP